MADFSLLKKPFFLLFLLLLNDPAAAYEHKDALDYSNSSMSGNPAAVNLITGSGALQKYIEQKFDIQNNHGIRIGGLWLGDVDPLLSGGIADPQRWTANSSFILDFSIDMAKMAHISGGLFDVQFLQFNGQPTNEQAGTVQGYNSLPGHPPLNRSELYQIWYRQAMLDDKFVFRIGKTAPTEEFGNVSRPIPLSNADLIIPSVTGLLYTPIFLNPSSYGVMPGYYNSAYGVTLNIAPIKQWYISLGAYDGSLAQSIQTGIRAAPQFNGSYFYIGETGLAWLLGRYEKPGYIGIGAWNQSGKIETSAPFIENSATGFYVYGTQRLWYKNPGVNNVGISSFYQWGFNNSDVLPIHRYLGGGLTGFGLIPSRKKDSLGMGIACSWLNQNIFNRNSEIMYQFFYQAQIINALYIEPAVSYIPTPGADENLSATWAGTLRAILLF